jgi:hypothetical protein
MSPLPGLRQYGTTQDYRHSVPTEPRMPSELRETIIGPDLSFSASCLRVRINWKRESWAWSKEIVALIGIDAANQEIRND